MSIFSVNFSVSVEMILKDFNSFVSNSRAGFSLVAQFLFNLKWQKKEKKIVENELELCNKIGWENIKGNNRKRDSNKLKLTRWNLFYWRFENWFHWHSIQCRAFKYSTFNLMFTFLSLPSYLWLNFPFHVYFTFSVNIFSVMEAEKNFIFFTFCLLTVFPKVFV